MKINSVNSTPNFGWKYPTHQKITAMLTDEFDNLANVKKIVAKSVIKPDFDDNGFKCNNHFYFLPEIFCSRASFLDITGQNNALARYKYHVSNFERLQVKDKNTALEHAGRALHFLQDMTQPQHIKRGSFFEKFLDLKSHQTFENMAMINDEKFIKNASNVELDFTPDSFSDLFDETVALTEELIPIRKDNKDSWTFVAQEGISNMIAVTREFLNIVSNSFK